MCGPPLSESTTCLTSILSSELFNLMNFLDPEVWWDLSGLEAEFTDLDEEKISDLHARLKPYFLRRIKADVMTDLPPKVCTSVPNSGTVF